ncbi:MAG: hypothetical protein K0Q59_3086 [Paenibacillus sp.]|jgi:hypothetical protein|nr:hypothetical protein [Paenibacillus sp.]
MEQMTEQQLDRWYTKTYGVSGHSVPAAQKLLAYVLVVGLPVALTGCMASQQPNVTAKQACEWEKKEGKTQLDCDDETSGGNWYGAHGFSSGNVFVSRSSGYYKSPDFQSNYKKYESTLPKTSSKSGTFTTKSSSGKSGIGSSSTSSSS